jgi:hypothetical protein
MSSPSADATSASLMSPCSHSSRIDDDDVSLDWRIFGQTWSTSHALKLDSSVTKNVNVLLIISDAGRTVPKFAEKNADPTPVCASHVVTWSTSLNSESVVNPEPVQK